MDKFTSVVIRTQDAVFSTEKRNFVFFADFLPRLKSRLKIAVANRIFLRFLLDSENYSFDVERTEAVDNSGVTYNMLVW